MCLLSGVKLTPLLDPSRLLDGSSRSIVTVSVFLLDAFWDAIRNSGLCSIFDDMFMLKLVSIKSHQGFP